ncbi:uncharacterized protein PG998_007496 [Apiospora kogelbergensis]|uniref:uncharacterized protein n=1 Tax=Apiospora kogelbergensis TaxID=1337665 RepID=UPI003132258A
MAPPPLPPRVKSPRFESSALAENRSVLRPRTTLAPPAVMPNNPVPIRDETIDDNVLPSSTQLFLLNNLDDLFPSPSQEVQEIFERPGERHKRTLARQQPLPPPHLKPSITSATVRNSPVTPHSTTVRQPMRRPLPCTRMNSSISPPNPRQNDVLHVSLKSHDQCKISDGDFPFLSTQDVFMSSQDVRELEDDKYSPVKLPKPLSPIARNQATREAESSKFNDTTAVTTAVIGTSIGQIMESGVAKTSKLNTPMVAGAQGHPPYPIDGPVSFSSQCSSLPDTPSLPRRNARAPQSRFIHPRGVPRSSAKGVVPDDRRSSSSNPFRFKTPNHATPRPSPTFNPNPKQSRETPRPSPKPFFTSSGTRESTHLAVERSKRSGREDTHTRRKATEDLVKPELTKRLKETPQDRPIFLAGPPSNNNIDDNDYELDEILLASDLANGSLPSRAARPQAIYATNSGVAQTSIQCPKEPVVAIPAQARPRSPDEKKPELVAQGKPKSSYEKMLELAAKQKECHDQGGKHVASLFDENEKENREQDIPAASQGTDYGEAGWDVYDLDLDLDSF